MPLDLKGVCDVGLTELTNPYTWRSITEYDNEYVYVLANSLKLADGRLINCNGYD